jgi:hypothetical protein
MSVKRDLESKSNIIVGKEIEKHVKRIKIRKSIEFVERLSEETKNDIDRTNLSLISSANDSDVTVKNPFHDLENLTWEEVTITITPQRYIYFSARDVKKRFEYSDFDIFYNRKSDKPSQIWDRFVNLPLKPYPRVKKNWAVWRRSISSVRRYFKKFLEINDDPFNDVDDVGFHKPKFNLIIQSESEFLDQNIIDKDINDLFNSESNRG